MMSEQADLFCQAHDSLAAAKILDAQGYHGFAASRAYYTMFYIAEAFLLGQGWPSQGTVPYMRPLENTLSRPVRGPQFHRYLIRGMEVRHAGDYGRGGTTVTPQEASQQITHAEEFLALAERLIGPVHLLTRG